MMAECACAHSLAALLPSCLCSCMQLEAQRTIVIEAIDATHCRHSVEGQVKVRMFGIGRLAENGVIESTVKTFKQLPYVLERCLTCKMCALLLGQCKTCLQVCRAASCWLSAWALTASAHSLWHANTRPLLC